MQGAALKLIAAMAAVIPAAIVASGSVASAATVDFTGAGVANYDIVAQSYGDSAEADFSYRTLNGGNNWGQFATQASDHVDYWADANYSGDQAIFASSNGQKLELGLAAGAGLKFTSITIDLGSYPNSTRNIAFKLFDAAWKEILGDDLLSVDGTSGVDTLITFALNTTSVYFQMGDDWDVGPNSVSFETAKLTATPLPGTLVMFGSGLAGLFGAYKRRKSVA